MKKLMLGNQALARGAYEAGVKVVSSYPGTPSTEVTEAVKNYAEVYAEWAPNEKVAVEVALGASFAGARALACMKHVGVNVAADPIFSGAYAGVNGGLVIVAADDPGMHSSQDEQDSRYYAKAAHIPMLEPSDSAECKDFMKLAYDLSERYDTPVMVRTTTRVAHSQSLVEEEARVEHDIKPYVKNIRKYTLMPATAKVRRLAVEERETRLQADCETLSVNRIERGDGKLGVVCSGITYQYVKEALPSADVFKIGLVNPLPIESIRKFADTVDEVVVIEELEPFFETQLKAAGIKCVGKELFSVYGEIQVPDILSAIGGKAKITAESGLPARPPVMCAGCPHRGVFYILSKLKAVVNADIGCYTLGAQPPLNAVDTVICMGASIGIAHGFEKALGRGDTKKNVAVIGDSTFVHSGITGLVNAVYNKSAVTLVILDNSTTGMTGHQNHPATGVTLKGEATKKLDLEAMCRACGVDRVQTVDAYDLKAVEKALKEEMAAEEVSVIIARRPCALLDKSKKPAFFTDACRKCGLCLKIGCPAIYKNADGTAEIKPDQCAGCGLCAELCAFGCIKEVK